MPGPASEAPPVAPIQGNVILTDANYEIMTLLRSHRDDAKGLQIMARHPYPLHSIRLRTPVTANTLTAALAAADAPNKLRSACWPELQSINIRGRTDGVPCRFSSSK